MEQDVHQGSSGSTTSEAPELPLRATTSLRFKYEAQAELIRKRIGDLETIRGHLGLSRRAICQELMVDPSAWTRWVKEGAPPHVYKSLEWYMERRSRDPNPSSNLMSSPSAIQRPIRERGESMRKEIPHSKNESFEVESDETEKALLSFQRELEKMRAETQRYNRGFRWVLLIFLFQALVLAIYFLKTSWN